MKIIKIIAIGMLFFVCAIFIAGVMSFAVEKFAPVSYIVLLVAGPTLCIYAAYLIFGRKD